MGCAIISGKAEDTPRKPKQFRSVLALRVALRVWRDSFFRYLSSVCTDNLAVRRGRTLLLRPHTFRRASPWFPNSSGKRALGVGLLK